MANGFLRNKAIRRSVAERETDSLFVKLLFGHVPVLRLREQSLQVWTNLERRLKLLACRPTHGMPLPSIEDLPKVLSLKNISIK
jgi:hypothetical protein